MIITFLDTVLVAVYSLLLFLSIFWLLVLWTPEQKEEKKRSQTPFFSVIVPAYNEEESIRETLESLIQLNYPRGKLEIIVVNDGSTDATPRIVHNFINEHPNFAMALLHQKNKGKGAAMNAGLDRAKGEFFACLDADSFVSPNALNVMLPHFEEDKNVAAVCPMLSVKSPQSVLQKVQWCEYIVNMFYKFLNGKLDCIHVTPGPFSIYRTSIIRSLGGFDEHTITEDLEIAIRLQQHQYRIIQTFDAKVETIAPNKWRDLFRQRVRWYKGSLDNTLQYKKLIFNKAYGDFGMVRMPTIIASGIFALILTAALGQALIKKTVHAFLFLKEIHFDILPLLRHYSFEFNLLNLPYFKITIVVTLLVLSFFIMVKSFQLVQERVTRYGRTWLSLVTYLLIYSFFITIVWLYISYMFIKKKRNFWF